VWFCHLQRQENPVFSHVSPQAPAVETAVEAKLDADLQRVLDAWPTLPEPIKAGILAMIRSVVPKSDGES
jgi:hypothetical protein